MEFVELTDATSCPGYWIARPQDGEPRPAVVVLPAIGGVNPYLEGVCDQLVQQGFVAAALDYHGPGRAPDLSSRDRLAAALDALPNDAVLADLQRCVTELAAASNVSEVGVLGFCVGGSYSLMAASRVDGIQCAVVFYGPLRYDRLWANKPVSPIDTVDGLRVPLLGHFGDDDHIIPVDQVEQLRAATAGAPAEIYRYPGAGHGFHQHQGPGYRPVAAQTAWSTTTLFLNWCLVRP